ncbi:MAG: hypothetical protein IJ790_03935 [Lachnospiraceae bacterium]|nr:hypothetical protein [Lachnospiraceae bacterium]
MNKLFTKKYRDKVQIEVIKSLNNTDLVNSLLSSSPRAIGDAVQTYLEDNFVKCLPKELIKDYNNQFARRSMADFAFTDINSNYYAVDSKTHNVDTAFNMPNLTSVERLSRFYEDHANYFTILMTSYSISKQKKPIFTSCDFVPIEMLDWNCLTLGALGWGQIQIANSNYISINETNTRKKWMLQLCDNLEIFYPNEIAKINERVNRFKSIRKFWEKQPD